MPEVVAALVAKKILLHREVEALAHLFISREGKSITLRPQILARRLEAMPEDKAEQHRKALESGVEVGIVEKSSFGVLRPEFAYRIRPVWGPRIKAYLREH